MKLFRFNNIEHKVKNAEQIGQILYKRGTYYDSYRIIPSCVDDSYIHGEEWVNTFPVYAMPASRVGEVIGYSNFYEKGEYIAL